MKEELDRNEQSLAELTKSSKIKDDTIAYYSKIIKDYKAKLSEQNTINNLKNQTIEAQNQTIEAQNLIIEKLKDDISKLSNQINDLQKKYFKENLYREYHSKSKVNIDCIGFTRDHISIKLQLVNEGTLDKEDDSLKYVKLAIYIDENTGVKGNKGIKPLRTLDEQDSILINGYIGMDTVVRYNTCKNIKNISRNYTTKVELRGVDNSFIDVFLKELKSLNKDCYGQDTKPVEQNGGKAKIRKK